MDPEDHAYDLALVEYTCPQGLLALLRQYRPYLEKVPSIRRAVDSVLPVPLPGVRVFSGLGEPPRTQILPCDLGILMCDPAWKIKLPVEIALFIHRPGEGFGQFLGRWRKTQVLLSQGYNWVLPQGQEHLVNEGTEELLPLFVVFPHSWHRIRRGLEGAGLPWVLQDPRQFGADAPLALTPEEGKLLGPP